MPCQWFYAHVRQRVGEAEPIQDARSVGADLDAGAHLAHRPRLFIDVHICACTQERQRCGEAADAAANDRYR